jgi:hypothetical protein
VKNKLRGNKDWYNTAELRLIYVSELLEGDVLALTSTWTNPDHPQYYGSELELYQHLQELYSDHWSLEYFMTTKKLSGRQARWAEYLSRFYFKLMYCTGKSNARADALSRKAEEVKS